MTRPPLQEGPRCWTASLGLPGGRASGGCTPAASLGRVGCSFPSIYEIHPIPNPPRPVPAAPHLGDFSAGQSAEMHGWVGLRVA